jgi:hypothetical protein
MLKLGTFVTAKLRGRDACRQGAVVRIHPLRIKGQSGAIFDCEGIPTLVVNPPFREEDMETWRVVYKCRRCGALDKSSAGSHEIVQQNIMGAVFGIKIPMQVGLPSQLLSTHSCPDGSIGVSDLIGGEEEVS